MKFIVEDNRNLSSYYEKKYPLSKFAQLVEIRRFYKYGPRKGKEMKPLKVWVMDLEDFDAKIDVMGSFYIHKNINKDSRSISKHVLELGHSCYEY